MNWVLVGSNYHLFPNDFQSLRSALPLELKTHNHNYLANELMTLIEGCTVQFLERYKNN